jgi:hypothetical protein
METGFPPFSATSYRGLICEELDRGRGFEGLIIEFCRHFVSGRYQERRQAKERHEKNKREPDGEFPRHVTNQLTELDAPGSAESRRLQLRIFLYTSSTYF